MIKYNTLETVKVTVMFDTPNDYHAWNAFTKSEEVRPCIVNGLRFVKYQWVSAHYSKEDALRIEVWLRTQKAKLDIKIKL